MEKIASYFDGDNYIQHNPNIPDQLSGLGSALDALAKQGVFMKFDTIHKVLGQGYFVLVVSDGHFGKDHNSFYDLFRVENGKIAETGNHKELMNLNGIYAEMYRNQQVKEDEKPANNVENLS